MVERVKRASRHALTIALVTLLTNGVQWAKAREERLTRDDLLASAFRANVQALVDARRVIEEALRTCARRKGIEPQVMLREEEPEVRALVSGQTPSQILDQIAAEELKRRTGGLQ